MTATKEKKAKKTVNFKSDENVLSMYLREINRIPLLSREDEDTTAHAAAQGNKAAREKLVNANLRFVVNVAKKYQGQGLPLSDLISEGNIGLLHAVDRFDVEKGYHFISYAVWWIRQAILKAICEKSRMIRLPLNRVNELIQIEKARKVIQEHNNTEAEIREIAGLLNMDKALVTDLLGISRNMVSLESSAYPGCESSPLGDFIEDEQYKAPEEKTVQNSLESDIEKVLKSLDKKEAAIIRYRYGLGNRSPMSLKEIGERFKLTKERIRQIEKKAIRRLRHPTRIQKLEAYVA
ncbi:MAG: RNA polymerase sigma factor RpoD/SigA [Treponema sp.]|jgi:RNA polymerase primary sigma factor|nr:RNA polymerase sigma factor RpoD/SigA [Treponema sp.]